MITSNSLPNRSLVPGIVAASLVMCLLPKVAGAELCDVSPAARALATKIQAGPETRASTPPMRVLRQLTEFTIESRAFTVDDDSVRISALELGRVHSSSESDGILGTIVLIPGYGFSKATLLGYAEAVASANYRAIMIDLPGQGESSGTNIAFGGEAAAVEALLTLLAQESINERVGLIGVSYGASIAVLAAGGSPHVDFVVAISPFAELLPTLAAAVGNRLIPVPCTKSEVLNRAVQFLEQDLGRKLSGSDMRMRIGEVSKPILIIAGDDDRFLPLSMAQELASRSPRSRLVIIPNGRHESVLTEHFPQSRKSLLNWLENLDQVD